MLGICSVLLTVLAASVSVDAQTWQVLAVAPPGSNATRRLIEVHFGTDRAQIAKSNGRFANSRDETGKLHTGKVRVLVPPGHIIGTLETEREIFGRFGHTSIDGFRIFDRYLLGAEAFRDSIRSASRRGGTLLFVHGFNTGFDQAALNVSQLGVDLKFEGALALFSWPSRNNPTSYFVDRNSVEESISSAAAYIRDVSASSSSTIIVAHSLGAHMTLKALERLRATQPQVRIAHLVLVAPDVPLSFFEGQREILDAMCERMSVYVNRHDKALNISEIGQGGIRLGRANPGQLKVEASRKVEIVDVSDYRDANTLSGMNHSYFQESRAIVTDIYDGIFLKIEPARRFGIVRSDEKRPNLWRMLP